MSTLNYTDISKRQTLKCILPNELLELMSEYMAPCECSRYYLINLDFHMTIKNSTEMQERHAIFIGNAKKFKYFSYFLFVKKYFKTNFVITLPRRNYSGDSGISRVVYHEFNHIFNATLNQSGIRTLNNVMFEIINKYKNDYLRMCGDYNIKASGGYKNVHALTDFEAYCLYENFSALKDAFDITLDDNLKKRWNIHKLKMAKNARRLPYYSSSSTSSSDDLSPMPPSNTISDDSDDSSDDDVPKRRKSAPVSFYSDSDDDADKYFDKYFSKHGQGFKFM